MMKNILYIFLFVVLLGCSPHDVTKCGPADLLLAENYWEAIHSEIFSFREGTGYTLTIVNTEGYVFHLSSFTPHKSKSSKSRVFIGATYFGPQRTEILEGSLLEQRLLEILGDLDLYRVGQRELTPLVVEFKRVLADRRNHIRDEHLGLAEDIGRENSTK